MLLAIRPQSLMYTAFISRIILQQMRNKILDAFFDKLDLRCNFSVNLVRFMVKFDSSAPGCMRRGETYKMKLNDCYFIGRGAGKTFY